MIWAKNNPILNIEEYPDKTLCDEGFPEIFMIEWIQASRCWWTCDEEYLLADYQIEGFKFVNPYKIHIAKLDLDPSSKFSNGYKGNVECILRYFFTNGGLILVMFVVVCSLIPIPELTLFQNNKSDPLP